VKKLSFAGEVADAAATAAVDLDEVAGEPLGEIGPPVDRGDRGPVRAEAAASVEVQERAATQR